ncbi:Uncharacterised protein [Vibrio cholerae]|nr:Uncharacterised protein [Vibrio cholerae]
MEVWSHNFYTLENNYAASTLANTSSDPNATHFSLPLMNRDSTLHRFGWYCFALQLTKQRQQQ